MARTRLRHRSSLPVVSDRRTRVVSIGVALLRLFGRNSLTRCGKLEQGKVAPVDLRQAAIGPGMAVFSRYARGQRARWLADAGPAPLSRSINQVLDEKLSQLEGERFGRYRGGAWSGSSSYGFDQGPFGTAETLSKGHRHEHHRDWSGPGFWCHGPAR